MNITLRGFRCYAEEKKVELPSKGLIQLSGDKGAGKSTVLFAIYYAFYGKVRKPYNYDKTTCTVELSYAGMVITRTSKPNKLSVVHKGREYIDEGAQGLIDSILGMNQAEFMASSFVVQRKNNSVVSMTPSEKVKFIETLAFNDNTHEEYKEQIKAYRISAKEEVTRSEGAVNVLEKQLTRYSNEIVEISLPDEINIEEIESKEKKIKKRLKKANSEVAKLMHELKELREKNKENRVLLKQKSKLEVIISRLEEELNELPDEVPPEELESLSNEIETLHRNLNLTEKSREYISKAHLYEKMKSEHTTATKKKIQKLEKSIPSNSEMKNLLKLEKSLKLKTLESGKIAHIYAEDISARSEATKKAKSILRKSSRVHKTKLKDIKRSKDVKYLLNKLTGQLKDYSQKLDVSIQKLKEYDEYTGETAVYECPVCETSLALKSEKLCKYTYDETTAEEYRVLASDEKMMMVSYKSNVKKLEAWITALEDIYKILDAEKIEKPAEDSVKEEEHAATRLIEIGNTQRILKSLRNQTLPESLVDLKSEVEELRSVLPKKFEPYSAKEFEKNSSKLKKMEKKHEKGVNTLLSAANIRDELSLNKKKLKRLNTELGHDRKLKKSPDISSQIDEISGQIDTSNSKIQKLNSKLSDMNELMDVVRKYQNYQVSLEKLQQLETEYAKETKSHLKKETVLQSAMQLERLSKEAEILAMEKTIESINQHAKVYLDDWFEDPISVRLSTTKATAKSSKVQINLQIKYNGYDYSGIEDLSGGEQQQCELAFMLAVNDMIGSGMLFLDECLNNLDGEINTTTLEYLRNYSQDKLSIVISHEAVEGLFDEVIKFEKV